jgi:hypothetical protein
MVDDDDRIAAKEALRRAQLEAARNLEPDCAYGAVGAGRYRADNERRRATAGIDPAATPQAGDFIAVYPNEQMYLFEDERGRRALRMKE